MTLNLKEIFNDREACEKAATDAQLDPRDRAACAERADELGHGVADLHHFVQIAEAGREPFFIGRYLVTQTQYARFLNAEVFANAALWRGLPKFSELDRKGQSKRLGDWGAAGWNYLQKALKDPKNNLVRDGVLYPGYWQDANFGHHRPHAPVVGVSWYEANAYCRWLLAHWNELPEGQQGLARPAEIRLPTEPEWTQAAGGKTEERFAWGKLTPPEDISRFANTFESRIGRTTPVWMYPQGASQPHQLMDLSGNVFEWQANCRDKDQNSISLRGGAWSRPLGNARIGYRNSNLPHYGNLTTGFRMALIYDKSDFAMTEG